jgi:hypothetical protein
VDIFLFITPHQILKQNSYSHGVHFLHMWSYYSLLHPVAESLDQKYYFELATSHKFFGLNMILLYLKILNQPLNPQSGLNYVTNWIKCNALTVRHWWKSYSKLKMILAGIGSGTDVVAFIKEFCGYLLSAFDKAKSNGGRIQYLTDWKSVRRFFLPTIQFTLLVYTQLSILAYFPLENRFKKYEEKNFLCSKTK